MATNRRELLRLLGTGAITAAAASSLPGCRLSPRPHDVVDEPPATPDRMPVLFVGHGSPMNAIEDNRWSRAFRTLATALPRPRAVVVVSAHWWTKGSLLTGSARPRTVHDIVGFPRALQEFDYPSPGHPDLATRIAGWISEQSYTPAALSSEWGLDHGTWSVLTHLLPEADVPVIQLSLDAGLSAEQHFDLGRALHQLRGDGVLVLASGNLTHNLQDAMRRRQAGDASTTPAWATQFDREIAQAILERDAQHLVYAWPDGQHARLAHPHPDHWFPLMYAFGASDDQDKVSFPIEGFAGSLSMRAVRWG